MEKDILDLFNYNKKMKFAEIEKNLKIRSNKLAYHLNQLLQKNILVKDNGSYALSADQEVFVPYISQKKSALPVILVHIGDSKNSFLIMREKRPYLGYLGLPGGRFLVGESLEEATKRIMLKKYGINVDYKETNSVSIEHVRKDGKMAYSFLLLLVSASTKDKINLIDIEKNRSKIIKSDYKLIKEAKKSIQIKTIYSKED